MSQCHYLEFNAPLYLFLFQSKKIRTLPIQQNIICNWVAFQRFICWSVKIEFCKKKTYFWEFGIIKHFIYQFSILVNILVGNFLVTTFCALAIIG